jgi:hypothetical protein
MSDQTEIVPGGDIYRLIRRVRDPRIILDNDLAAVYGVPTKRLNEQYRRNLDHFPEDFAFRLTEDEWGSFTSQIGTLEAGGGIRSQFATASKRNIRYLPIAFTEHGALMTANIPEWLPRDPGCQLGRNGAARHRRPERPAHLRPRNRGYAPVCWPGEPRPTCASSACSAHPPPSRVPHGPPSIPPTGALPFSICEAGTSTCKQAKDPRPRIRSVPRRRL